MTKSGIPSPFRSAIDTGSVFPSPLENGNPPVSYATPGRNVPSPLPSRTLTVLWDSVQPGLQRLVTTRSGLPCTLGSPIARDPVAQPNESWMLVARNVPSPLPRRTATVPSPFFGLL